MKGHDTNHFASKIIIVTLQLDRKLAVSKTYD